MGFGVEIDRGRGWFWAGSPSYGNFCRIRGLGMLNFMKRTFLLWFLLALSTAWGAVLGADEGAGKLPSPQSPEAVGWFVAVVFGLMGMVDLGGRIYDRWSGKSRTTKLDPSSLSIEAVPQYIGQDDFDRMEAEVKRDIRDLYDKLNLLGAQSASQSSSLTHVNQQLIQVSGKIDRLLERFPHS